MDRDDTIYGIAVLATLFGLAWWNADRTPDRPYYAPPVERCVDSIGGPDGC